MAVKVMLAPAIATGEIQAAAAARRAPAALDKKPRRRRSSVYDHEGNEVFITLMCLKCHKMRPLSQFGLRRMADGAIRNQPWCRTCRSGASPKARKGSVAAGDSAETVESPETAESPAAAPAAEPPRAASDNLAAEVAASLYRGRR
jgi:hypothetical protein